MEGRHYVYRHIRLDTNQPFYIGIGTKKKEYQCHTAEYTRAFIKTNRSKHWKSIVEKAGYKVEILFESDNHEEIKAKEIEFIALYGRKVDGGTLTNSTLGGDGTLGHNLTPEQLERRNKAIREAFQREDAKANLSEANKKVWQREGQKEKFSKARTGVKKTPEAVRNFTERIRKNCKPVKDLLTNREYSSLGHACEHLGLDRPKEINKIYYNSPNTRFVYLEDYDRIQREFTDN